MADDPTPQPAVTQTYATQAIEVPSPPAALVLTATAIAAKTASSTLSDSGTADAAAVASSLNQAQADLGAKINALRTQVVALTGVVNLLVDQMQSRHWVR